MDKVLKTNDRACSANLRVEKLINTNHISTIKLILLLSFRCRWFGRRYSRLLVAEKTFLVFRPRESHIM